MNYAQALAIVLDLARQSTTDIDDWDKDDVYASQVEACDVVESVISIVGDVADSEHKTLLGIQEKLNGVEWSPDTLEAIAALMNAAGFHVGEPR